MYISYTKTAINTTADLKLPSSFPFLDGSQKGIHQGACSEMELTHPNALHKGLLDSE